MYRISRIGLKGCPSTYGHCSSFRVKVEMRISNFLFLFSNKTLWCHYHHSLELPKQDNSNNEHTMGSVEE